MPDAAQFSLGLFDTPSVSWTLDAPTVTSLIPRADLDAAATAEPEPTPAFDTLSTKADRKDAGSNYALSGDRDLARGWPARARDNVDAIVLSKQLEAEGRAPTPDEQARLLRFIGFGATELAQNCFPRPGETEFRPGWEEIGQDLAAAITEHELAALQRATQYAHFTPETIIRAMWRAAERLGFCEGRVLEPGMGTGLFFALLPETLRDATRLTGVEYDPITARIARLIHPQARVRCEDFVRSRLGGGFDLAIGNPPFADRVVRADPALASLGLRLHDFFIARAISRLRPGGVALFVTSTGTMDKASTVARSHIAGMADLIGAVRLPEGSMRATAGTDVVIDILVFQRRADGQPQGGADWFDLEDLVLPEGTYPAADPDSDGGDMHGADRADTDANGGEGAEQPGRRHLRAGIIQINRYFVEHPEMVLGSLGQRRGIYRPGLSTTCRARPDDATLEDLLDASLARLPAGIVTPSLPLTDDEDDAADTVEAGTAAEGATIKEGSFLTGKGGALCQIVGGVAEPVAIKAGKAGDGISPRAAKIIRGLMPVRDAVREVLRAQATGRPWTQAQIKLRCAYSAFIRHYGPINHTVVTTLTDAETGEEREVHRRPNLAPFADDPDCWLVASIEEYDLESGQARMGPIFNERVIAPPTTPLIASAADALAVTLNEMGHVDPERLGELLECSPEEALAQLGTTVFQDPFDRTWQTADAYLSGAVRTKLIAAEAAATLDSGYQRNVLALRNAQPRDIPPSDIAARLGAPWLPTDDIVAFVAEIMGAEVRIFHSEEIATWSVDGSAFIGTAAGTSTWGTGRRHAGQLLHDALNSATPQIYDTIYEDGVERRVLNAEATEAAKEKLNKIKTEFSKWVWADPERADRLARIYNSKFNNLVPRHFDGSHLTLPGASNIIALYPHQKRVIWRIISTGSSYVAHAVGSGKTFSIAAAVMEQKRLGLITKAMLVVPGHCLAQASREFLQLYPTARILVADETNFTKDKRSRFLARAATAHWDAIIITHSAFRFIAVPAEFERGMITEQLASYAVIMLECHADDRTTRKRLEAMKEKLTERLEAIKNRRDDMLTIAEIGIDQLIVDEAQEFRKLSFATNRSNLKGVDAEGSQRAWDLFVKSRFIATKNPRRALIQASGTPITNTMGEMFTLLRYQNEPALRVRGIHQFDAWASAFGDTSTELELQPSGAYKPVERFAQFVNIPELIDLFRNVADVVLKDDLRQYLRLPRIAGGQRQLITSAASQAFRAYQRVLTHRIEEIEKRTRRVVKGDDILLSVITDGRHAAIDMRLIYPDDANDPGNKLNQMITNVFRIWQETARDRYRRRDGSLYPIPGAGQLIFSDLGTIAVESKRGFSAYRWIRQELVRLGVPAGEIAYMQDFKRSADKQRLFGDFNAGRVRILIGSSDTMGTGVNVQARLKALHHLDVPWLPSQIEQREGRIERQGNQNDEIAIVAYATLGSMDATMWQNNERKKRFIDAALSGDRSIRTIDDIGDAANQFALAKAIASGDARLLRKAGLAGEIARLDRQRAAHFDDQLSVRRHMFAAQQDQAAAERRILALCHDLARRVSTRGELFRMVWDDRATDDRRVAGALLLSRVRLAALEGGADDIEIARIGGFGLRRVQDGSASRGFDVALVLDRTDYPQAIPLESDLTPLGLIARIEHILNNFEADLAGQTRRHDEAERRFAGYQSRLGQPFPLAAELADKLAQMAALEADLAQTGKEAADSPDKPAGDETGALTGDASADETDG